ncbi:CbtA family protein [Mycobacterium montefiorense]|uniref:Cobalt transporter n=1 Tax=Mycobacterium montefiorense TaxID=154654 RepID=A0AA37UYZ8_9MYCO|nr:CbtA family protein [Mycobacterium montefiorense]GBG36090.1 cobalt transporter [Mycobacterium montefiorense]GKU33141.1 cobalt transporter [Mycobacterium montefiorense]GKU38389.1 cobalt transporter [Mycobacterium montefiorense]GKU46844.1 cobalt transporter [Mycobacterium montefiorense]GKU51383.1 cobalt transporter [Mycobacterium montefiorense]
MEKRLIGRGLLAGAIGAVLAFVFARLCAEPVIARAIDFEDGRTDAENAHGVHEHGAELFTRGVQSNPGLGFGVLIFGVAMGALFAVLFCVTYARTAGRADSPAPRQLSLLLAAGAFVAVYLVPFVKYPPNPPAVGQSDTIGARTGWYLLMVLASVVLASGAVLLARRLADRFGRWNSRLLAAGAYLVAVVVVMVALPTVDETPAPLRDASGTIIYPGFPADVLYEFRLLSLGTQLLLWVTIGLVFATLADRLLTERSENGRVSSIAA